MFTCGVKILETDKTNGAKRFFYFKTKIIRLSITVLLFHAGMSWAEADKSCIKSQGSIE